MISFAEARNIAASKIGKLRLLGDVLVILDTEIIEKEYAWIFPYTAKRYSVTKNSDFAIAGNAPLFVSKYDGEVFTYSTGLGIDGMIDEHEESTRLWILSVAGKMPLNLKKLLQLKQLFDWSHDHLIQFKQQPDGIIESGAKTRLIKMQQSLNKIDINTSLALNKFFDEQVVR